MAVLRNRVHRVQLSPTRMLCIDAISYGQQGADPKKRASVDVTAETTRFEVLLVNPSTNHSVPLAGAEDVWLKRTEAKLFVEGFMAGVDHRAANGKTGGGE